MCKKTELLNELKDSLCFMNKCWVNLLNWKNSFIRTVMLGSCVWQVLTCQQLLHALVRQKNVCLHVVTLVSHLIALIDSTDIFLSRYYT